MGRSRELAELAAAYDGGSLGFRNRIINGAFDVWQRGTSFTSGYTADRWFVGFGTPTSYAQSADVPTGLFRFSMSVSGSGFITLTQRIESRHVYDLFNTPVTISFWVKQTSGAGSNSIAVQITFPTTTDNYAAVTGTQTILATATTGWTLVSVTIPASQMVSAVANGMQIGIYANTAGAATFLITGVQLEAGSVATPFERRAFGTELALCQRYYIRFQTAYWAAGYGETTNKVGFAISLPVSMRAQPSVANDADTNGITANGSLYNVTANSATIDNSWWNGSNGVVFITTNAQVTRWTTAWGRVGTNLQLNAEL